MAVKKKQQLADIQEYNFNGIKKEDAIKPNEEIFNINTSPKLIAQYIRVYQTNKRQGTASTKTRAQVSGTTKKMYKQKGTGKARHGSYKAPIFKGGGVVGGPKPKLYELSLNKKQKVKVLFSALTDKLQQGKIINLDLNLESKLIKTKSIYNWLKILNLLEKKTVFVLNEADKKKLALGTRNIQGVLTVTTKSLNAYQVLNADQMVFVGKAIQELGSHYMKLR